MLDYYGSFIKDKESIYTEIKSIFSTFRNSYINMILDEMYSSEYLINEISVSGWTQFIKHDVIRKIKKKIYTDTLNAKYRLLIVRLLDTSENCNKDVMRLIAEYRR
jgi:hypothetical protein